jgi:23S rRNA (guanine2445-N2)-methyltransferase / 23S rRNA (guanine2069-N7)-methyltransferase
MSHVSNYFASTPKHVTHLLVQELHDLGARDLRESGAGVSFQGDLALAYRACLWSRFANRILLPLARFKAATPEQLYEQVKAIAWEEHLAADGTLAVDCTAVDAAISHSHYAALKTKDAVVDHLRELFGVRPSVDVEQPHVRINLHLRENQARVSLDLSGGSLHRRGYRSEGAAAPLKENLAAAILALADWPALARDGAPLLDPMCGSGTLLIEAALMAADVAPGLYRGHFGFLHWKQHDAAAWDALLREARERREQGLQRLPSLRGYDADANAVRGAWDNIGRAGLTGRVHVERCAIAEAPTPKEERAGLLVVNPPYGERLGNVQELRTTYAQLGALLRRLSGWRAAVFTGNPELAAFIGVPSQRSDELFNGPIECRLFHYQIAAAAPRAPSAEPAALTPGAQMFANRLRKNLKQWERWARDEGVECYRVYDSDMPEYALAIDLYHGDGRYVHVQEYQAPSSVDATKAQTRLQEALSVLPQVLDVPVERVYFKVRRKQKGSAQYEKMDAAGHFVEVRESGLRLLVNFTDYLDTGLFLDHRVTRTLVRDAAAGKRFLNLFAYTGAATVYAAAGGARATTTVDMSRTYIAWAQRNMALNGYGGAQHRYVQDDCLAWLVEQGEAGREQFDLIFLDPPTFSNSKRMNASFDVQRDHVALIRDALRLLARDGELIFSNNFRRFKLDTAALADLRVDDVTAQTIPRDFSRNPRIHQCWRIRRKG